MQWFYAKGGEQTGPLEEQAFHELAGNGVIDADTPVWHEGMPSWVPFGQIGGRRVSNNVPRKKLILKDGTPESPETAPTDPPDAPPPAGTTTIPATPEPASAPSLRMATAGAALLEPLYRARRWMKFAGILTIIAGVLQVFSIWGIVIAWLPIWMGILLTGAAKQITLACESSDDTAAFTAMDKLRLYFKIMGILMLIFLLIGVATGLFFLGIATAFR